jgi:hypothetical protein
MLDKHRQKELIKSIRRILIEITNIVDVIESDDLTDHLTILGSSDVALWDAYLYLSTVKNKTIKDKEQQ